MEIEEVMTGLIANIPRREAIGILGTVRAMSVAMSDADNGLDLMDLAGVSGQQKTTAEIESWRGEHRRRFKGVA